MENEITEDMICKECHGKGVKEIRTFHIFEVCQLCHGDGKINWIEDAMGKSSDYQNECDLNNLKILYQGLYEFCSKMGYRLQVRLEKTQYTNMLCSGDTIVGAMFEAENKFKLEQQELEAKQKAKDEKKAQRDLKKKEKKEGKT